MSEHVLAGRPASPGMAVGPAWRLDPEATPAAPGRSPFPTPSAAGDAEPALSALAGAAAELDSLAERLGGEEGQIVATGALMARDPALHADVVAEIERGLSPAAAIGAAVERAAAMLAAIDDELLAARADDVRSVGRRALRRLAGGSAEPPPDAVVVATDAGPADVVELAGRVNAFALAAGGHTAHAAIVARSLGVPMVACAGPEILAATGHVVVDGDRGEAVLDPGPARVAAAREAATARRRGAARAVAERDLAAVTSDGRRIAVLANVASRPEVQAALAAGAEGAGLVRTELSFLDARGWPTEEEHRRALEPVLAPLAGRPVTVRVLDFGGDKTPPFLAGATERGIDLLLAAPDALEAQLRAVLAAAAATDLRIMLPLVGGPEAMLRARVCLDRAAAAIGSGAPAAGARSVVPLGAMIETPEAATAATAIALVSDFLSVGTNDLTAATLGVDRFAAGEAAAHDPRVLAAIARVVRAARGAGITLEVCGEAASEPHTLPLLLGLGVTEVSVGAARVGVARRWIRDLRRDEASVLAHAALSCRDAASVARLLAPTVRRLELLERRDDGGEAVERLDSVVSVGPQA